MDLIMSLVRYLGKSGYLFETFSDHFHALVCSSHMTLHAVPQMTVLRQIAFLLPFDYFSYGNTGKYSTT
jgi:hypothetical protein